MKKLNAIKLISFFCVFALLFSLLSPAALAKDSDDFFMRGSAKEGEVVTVLGDTFTERLTFERNRYKDGEYFAGNPHSGRPLARSSEDCICTNCYSISPTHTCNDGCGDSCGTYYDSTSGTAAAWQCYGFACQLGYDIFGIDPLSGWNISYNLEAMVPGDIIRYSWSATSFNPHVIFVTNIVGDTVYYADCNSKGPCQISWDNEIKLSTLYSYLNYAGATYTDSEGNSHPTRMGVYHCPTNENQPFVPGDIDGDGKIAPSDLLVLTKYLAGDRDGLSLIHSTLDANCDDKVNAKDYFTVLDYMNNGCPLYDDYWYNYWYYNPVWQ